MWQEMARIEKTFHKFDKDHSGDISTIELSDMMRDMGQCPRIEEVRSFLSSVDIDGNGVLDLREFIRFIRLFREKQLARVKMAFVKMADHDLDPPRIRGPQVPEAVHRILSEEAVEVAQQDGEAIDQKDLDFEDFALWRPLTYAVNSIIGYHMTWDPNMSYRIL